MRVELTVRSKSLKSEEIGVVRWAVEIFNQKDERVASYDLLTENLASEVSSPAKAEAHASLAPPQPGDRLVDQRLVGAPSCFGDDLGRRRRAARAVVARSSSIALRSSAAILSSAMRCAALDQRFGIGLGLGDDRFGFVLRALDHRRGFPVGRARPWPHIRPSAPRRRCAALPPRRAARGSRRSSRRAPCRSPPAPSSTAGWRSRPPSPARRPPER